MTTSHLKLARLALCLGLIVIHNSVTAFPDGAPVKHTGAVGENDCASCHFGQLSNTSPVLELSGFGNALQAGRPHTLTFVFTHADMKVAGMQITVRTPGDTPDNTGRMHSPQFRAVFSDGIAYLNHTAPINAEDGRVVITLEWDVPEYVGEAVINAALVAGNDDQSPFGDSVITIEQRVNILP